MWRSEKTCQKPLNSQIKDVKLLEILKDSRSDCVCKHAQINMQWNISKVVSSQSNPSFFTRVIYRYHLKLVLQWPNPQPPLDKLKPVCVNIHIDPCKYVWYTHLYEICDILFVCTHSSLFTTCWLFKNHFYPFLHHLKIFSLAKSNQLYLRLPLDKSSVL